MGERTRNLEWRQRNKEYSDADVLAQVLAATTDTCKLTHPMVNANSAAGAVTTFTVPDGEPGQILIIRSAHANDIEVVPTTATGWSACTLAIIGDTVVMLYANDTDGWILLSLMSVIVNTSPAYTAA